MNQKEITEILEKHSTWLRGEDREAEGRADFRGANLRFVNLRRADLREADFSGADLRGADLRYANLSYANLRDADLRGADLRDANLTGANLISFTFNRDTAYFQFNSMIRIGCDYHTVQHWLENYKEIGKKAGYSEQEIQVYGQFIRMVQSLSPLVCADKGTIE